MPQQKLLPPPGFEVIDEGMEVTPNSPPKRVVTAHGTNVTGRPTPPPSTDPRFNASAFADQGVKYPSAQERGLPTGSDLRSLPQRLAYPHGGDFLNVTGGSDSPPVNTGMNDPATSLIGAAIPGGESTGGIAENLSNAPLMKAVGEFMDKVRGLNFGMPPAQTINATLKNPPPPDAEGLLNQAPATKALPPAPPPKSNTDMGMNAKGPSGQPMKVPIPEMPKQITAGRSVDSSSLPQSTHDASYVAAATPEYVIGRGFNPANKGQFGKIPTGMVDQKLLDEHLAARQALESDIAKKAAKAPAPPPKPTPKKKG